MRFRTARLKRLNRYRRYLAIALVICIPIGLWTKMHEGVLQAWVNGFAGAIIYEMFWIFLVGLIFPELTAGAVAAIIFILTCGLELLQLWNPPTLAALRSTTAGKLFLGSTFSWWDFPHYLLGCLLGWWILQQLHRKVLTPSRRDRL
jgi:hypothetical protein